MREGKVERAMAIGAFAGMGGKVPFIQVLYLHSAGLEVPVISGVWLHFSVQQMPAGSMGSGLR